jgi:uncharacterized protein YlxW (UPF0749 family)
VTEPPGQPERGRRLGRAFGADLLTDLFENALEPGYAAAAERLRARGPDPRWKRRSGRAGTAVVLLLFGFLLATAYHQVVASRPETSKARSKLVNDVKARQSETDALQRRDDALRAEVARARDRALSDGGGSAAAEQLREQEAVAGLAKVAGPGVTVTLTDAPSSPDPVTGRSSSDNLGRVLDLDLQTVVNALWRSGAEAVAVDGQRLSATSTIRAAGEAILVDFRPVDSPYAVTAIGPGSLRSRFDASDTAGDYREISKRYHMGFSVRSDRSLTLPAAPEPQLRYAKPVPSSSPSSSPSGGK